MHTGHIRSHCLDHVLFGKRSVPKPVSDFAGISVTYVGSSKKGGQFIEFALRPIRQRMIVTLGASHVGSKEDVEGIGQVVERHSGITQKVARRAGTGDGALGGKQIIDELVPGSVFGNLILEPSLVMAVVGSLDRLFVPKKVGQPIKEM